MIPKDKQIAIVAGDRLGDGLILLLMAYNFHLNGYKVTFINSPLLTLKEWFPWAKIEPHFPQKETSEKLKDFDVLIFQHHNRHAREPITPNQERYILYGNSLYMKRRSLVDIYFDACKLVFKLPKLVRSNGIEIPKDLQYRQNKKRIVLHPVSLRPEKNWPKEKFIQLGKELIRLGYEPQYIVSPSEEKDWADLRDLGFDLVVFQKLSDVATYIYESAYLIGNDSGLAHLASTLNIPSVPLFIRPGVVKRWRPNFYPCFPVVPWLHLPGPKLKERYWKQIVSVNYVLRIFKRARKATESKTLV